MSKLGRQVVGRELAELPGSRAPGQPSAESAQLESAVRGMVETRAKAMTMRAIFT